MSTFTQFARSTVLLLGLTSITAWAACPQDQFSDVVDFSHADFETAQSNDKFGEVVATNGDVVAVGFPQIGSGIGHVYLFQRNATTGSFSFLRKLDEPGFAETGDQFGVSLAMQGDTLVVGAIHAGDVPANDAGAVYVFARNQGGPDAWGLRQSIIGLEEDGLVNFGGSIALDGDRMLVGDADASSEPQGRVVVFERNGSAGNFQPVAELLAPIAELGSVNAFARQVALDGATAVISDPLFNADQVGGLEGRVYVFARNPANGQWNLVKHLALPAGTTGFGTAISISDDRIAVGNGQAQVGRVFVFERNAGGAGNWGQVADVSAGVDSQTDDRFGAALDLHSKELMVGAQSAPGIAGSTGAAYVFRRDEGGPGNWGQVQKLFSQTNNSRSTYGAALDWAGGVAVIGDPFSDDPGFSPGSRIGRAYVYYNDVIFCDPFE